MNPYQDRNQAFGQGSAPQSLAQSAAAYNSLIPDRFKPTSSLHQLMPSGNGSSAGDAQRMLLGGGLLPTGNGMAANTYEQKRPFLSTSLNA